MKVDIPISKGDVYLKQLESTYQILQSSYTTGLQGASFLLAGEGVLLTLCVQFKSSALLFVSGILSLLLCYLLTRLGLMIGGLSVLGIGLEKKLGVKSTLSLSKYFVGSFRSGQFVSSLNLLSTDNKPIWELSKSSYSIYHLGRSKTNLFIFIVGILQIIGSLYLYLAKIWVF